MVEIDYRPLDRDIWEHELEDFVPKKIFYVHTHLWDERFCGNNTDGRSENRVEVDRQYLRKVYEIIFPDREVDFLILGMPLKDMDTGEHNAWVANEVAGEENSYASMVVTPDMPPEYVERKVKKYNFFGLKPYRVFASDLTNAEIVDYLPETLIEVADQLGLVISLHLSKQTGPADPENLKALKEYTRRYPKVKWILAHCARAFNSFFLEKSIHVLKHLPNLWYDTSAVNDLYTHYLLLKHEDCKRIMFGSDNVSAGCMRGKYITYGRAWEPYKGNEYLEHCDATPTLVIYEQLRQQRQMSQAEMEDIFYGNASRLIGMRFGEQNR